MKSAVLKALKIGGLFALSSALTANRLRILCYHGVSQGDEHKHAPGTFMREVTFRARMEFLNSWGASVLPLDEGIRRLRNGSLPARAVVITIDDGFYSSYAYMAPILEEMGFPATVYVSTYYVVNQRPIANLVSMYGMNEAECRERRQLMLMTLEEVQDLENRGFDIQLHTHRHRYPVDDRESADREIRDNVAVLGDRRHFCYPSGVHASWQADWLAEAAMDSATTTDFGLASRRDSRYALPRICDSEVKSQLDFEASVSGFKDVFLRARARGRSTL